MLDPQLAPEARRLALAAALTGQTRRWSARRIPPDTAGTDLLALARRFGEEISAFERTYGLRFEPAYPGVSPGPEVTGSGVRMVCACAAVDAEERPVGVVFTTLIAGRSVQVSVAPSHTPIPPHWLPFEAFA